MRNGLPWCGLHRGLLMLALSAGPALAAGDPAPDDFAWRATLELPANSSAARITLPAQAIARLQSPLANDLRVFNAADTPVPFALSAATPPSTTAAAAEVLTREYPALALRVPDASGKLPPGSVQIGIDTAAGERKLWVQLDTSASAGTVATSGGAPASRMVLFDLREQKQTLRGLRLRATLPPNLPVAFEAATSQDLANWAPLALRGRLYRFEAAAGAEATPRNDTLDIDGPAFEAAGRYLRLSWTGFDGVSVEGLSGVVAMPATAVPRARLALPPGTVVDAHTLQWTLAFARPLAALALETPRANNLVPVQVQGRMDASQPWRTLGQSVVYRLGSPGAESTSPPLLLAGPAVRELRVRSTHGLPLDAGALQATAEFAPLQVVFLASGAGPFQLVAGRSDTSPADLGGSLLASVAPGPQGVDALPLARITAVAETPAGDRQLWLGIVPMGPMDRRLILWAVLLGGALALAMAAWLLLRQVRRPAPPGP